MLLHGRTAIVGGLLAVALLAAPARAADPVVAAAGDIACGPAETGVFPCQQMATSGLLVSMNPTAVLALGDNQYNTGSLADYNAFYNPSWGRLKAITHPVIGNHEFGGMPEPAGYFDYFGARAGPRPAGYYSFDVGTWHLIALNSNCDRVPGGCGAGSPQERWLKADLQAHPAACVLAFEHHPLWATPTFEEPRVQPLFQDLYDADAELLVTAHDHIYDRFAPSAPDQSVDEDRGVQQFIVGTGGRDLAGLGADNPNSVVRDNDTFGVLRLTLHPTSYDWQFIPADANGFTDAGTRQCHGPGAPPPAPQPPSKQQPPPSQTPPSLVPNPPGLTPEDLEEPPDRVITRLSVASVSPARTRMVIRGRLTTGASAGRLRLALRRGTVHAFGRATGGRSGSWRAVVPLTRRARRLHRFALEVRYLGESAYTPVTLRATVRR